MNLSRTPCNTERRDYWFSSDPAEQEYALLICQSCPFQKECAELGKHETHGIWGGIQRDPHLAKRCRNCRRKFRGKKDKVADFPGTVQDAGGGMCKSCKRNPERGLAGKRVAPGTPCKMCGDLMGVGGVKHRAKTMCTMCYDRHDYQRRKHD